MQDLSSIKTLKEILAKYEIKPSKGMGQNFLVNKLALEKIIKSADLKSDDIVLEVGPGIGTLTIELAKTVKKVIAIEKDKYMCQILKETLKNYRNVEIINGDVLKTTIELPKPYKLVANIPYYLTSPLIRKFLENHPNNKQPEEIILMVQKEVAQRICNSPPNMSLLAVSVQFYATAKIISYVKKENFWPKPKVDSAIIKITPHKKAPQISNELFFKIVKAGFSQPRKQLGNNLSKMLKIDKDTIFKILLLSDIEPKRRAETLSINDWINLTNSF
ncbi:MAG: 16S rRNA (adenine(1518)-N(6)/adenine(1519)-N(6))-dimethyltransferase RsmA [Candidatus Staskawiczbacteria bacterium]|nr:16S rRNA (adenine(1518)-N(6)/adenine(1519)-N(6))-dimethyltransferase RsmA [Candidatus Staskawiczbacteria bacterium]